MSGIWRRALLAASLAPFVTPTKTHAQQRAPRPTVGVLLNGDLRQHQGPDHPLILGLKDLGWIDGETATVLVREAKGRMESLPALIAELLAARPAVIIAAGPQPIGLLA